MPGDPRAARGHNYQDRRTSKRRKTKIISQGEVLKGEVLKAKPRRILTRPGRLRARSGSKLPEANVPLRAFEGWVKKYYLFPVQVRATFFGIMPFG